MIALQPRPEINRARSLRQTKTLAEIKLWRALRGLNRDGWNFRQQSPIGKYIVDFVDHSHALVIEADGSQHMEPAAIVYDKSRTAWLESQGYRVLRLSNHDILQNLEGCIDIILRLYPRASCNNEEPDASSPAPL
ncbi:MAG: endonuclease domain-containing protein, partial [Hyphomicrobiaceae bacterium]|nr:endonuclease domain-containing protein [Hyphomicrobiaceae bacterium]